MPKKVNQKAEDAKARKVAAADEKKQREAKSKEDALWADEGAGGKAAKKKAEEEKKRAEAAQKRAELEQLKAAEEKEMASLSKKGVRGPKADSSPKVTRAELDRIREEDAKRKEEGDRLKKKAAARIQDEEDYARVVNVANTNRLEKSVDARNLDEAVTQLSAVTLDEQAALDKHPEKRLRAAYKVSLAVPSCVAGSWH